MCPNLTSFFSPQACYDYRQFAGALETIKDVIENYHGINNNPSSNPNRNPNPNSNPNSNPSLNTPNSNTNPNRNLSPNPPSSNINSNRNSNNNPNNNNRTGDTRQKTWEDEILEEMKVTNLYLEKKQLTLVNRTRLLRSEEYLDQVSI